MCWGGASPEGGSGGEVSGSGSLVEPQQRLRSFLIQPEAVPAAAPSGVRGSS